MLWLCLACGQKQEAEPHGMRSQAKAWEQAKPAKSILDFGLKSSPRRTGDKKPGLGENISL